MGVRIQASHYRTIMGPYWLKGHPQHVLEEFAARVRGDLSPQEIREELIPSLPQGSTRESGDRIRQLREALERAAAR